MWNSSFSPLLPVFGRHVQEIITNPGVMKLFRLHVLSNLLEDSNFHQHETLGQRNLIVTWGLVKVITSKASRLARQQVPPGFR